MFSRSRNPLLTFLLSYHVRVTSKIQVNFRYRRYWWFCLMNFWNFFNIYVFEVKKSIADIPTELPCSGDLENPGQLPVQRYSKVLMILSYKFLKFLQYSCFRGQEIHCWHSYWATMFGWPRKSRSTSGTGGTDDSVLWIFEISSIFMFSRSRNPLLAFLLSYHVRVTLEIQVNFRYRGTRRYWWLCLINFWHFFTIYVFEVKQLEFWHFYRATCLGDLENPGQLPVQAVLMILSYGFLKFLYYLCFRGQNPLLIFLLSYLVWVTSKIWVNFRF